MYRHNAFLFQKRKKRVSVFVLENGSRMPFEQSPIILFLIVDDVRLGTLFRFICRFISKNLADDLSESLFLFHRLCKRIYRRLVFVHIERIS